MTALSWAARGAHADTIALLLQHGAEVNAVDGYGYTPLIYAAAQGCLRSTTLLLEAGANPHHRDQEGHSALDHVRRAGGLGARTVERTDGLGAVAGLLEQVILP
jgi:ankyrin repeat protein